MRVVSMTPCQSLQVGFFFKDICYFDLPRDSQQDIKNRWKQQN